MTDPTVSRNKKPKGEFFEVKGAALWFKHLGTRKTVRKDYPSLLQSMYRPPANSQAAAAAIETARKEKKEALNREKAIAKVPTLKLNQIEPEPEAASLPLSRREQRMAAERELMTPRCALL